LAESYIKGAAHEAGSTAEMAVSRKEEKYIEIETRHIFQPTAMETGVSAPLPTNSSAVWVTELPPAQARLGRHVFSAR